MLSGISNGGVACAEIINAKANLKKASLGTAKYNLLLVFS